VKKTSEHFCQAITAHFGCNGKPLANLVMSIASYTSAKSIVEYSQSPLYHYQYSSISKTLARILANLEEKDPSKFGEQVQKFILEYLPPASTIRLHLDSMPLYKPLSNTLKERTAVYLPNLQIQGQKPVEIGYNISSLNQGFSPNWSIPLSLTRTPITKTYKQVGIQQIKDYLKQLPKESPLVVNCADSSYGNAEFFESLHQYANLVNIVRLKNRNVYASYEEKDTTKLLNTPKKGAKPVFGDCYDLRKIAQTSNRKNPISKEICTPKTSIESKIPDQTATFLTKTHKGRAIQVELKMYHNMLIRSKNKHNMKDKPFNLLVVEHLDAQSLKPIHQKPIYLTIIGTQKDSIAIVDAYLEHYKHRFDLEANNRFLKQQLALDKFQTCVLDHFDLWLSIIQLVECLLLLASQEVENQPKKWQQYNHKEKKSHTESKPRLSIAQTRKSCESFFCNFDQSPFLPKISNKGKGRKLGKTFTPKPTFKPIKKKT
jgi:hypothetical protein